MPPHSPRCLAVAVRWWRVAQRLPGWQVKPRAAEWRPRQGNPCTHQFRGRVCLPACLRHHSVVDGRPLPRSSLACAQTASGAGHVEAVSRLCATSHGRAALRSGAQCAFPSLKTEFVMRPTVLAALLVFSFPAVPAMAAPSGSQAVPAYVTAAINDPARAADHHDDARRQIAAVMTFAQVKPGDTVVELVPASGYWTRGFSAIVGLK